MASERVALEPLEQLQERVAAIREHARHFAISQAEGDSMQAASDLWAALQAITLALEELAVRIETLR